ncbi:MAG: J domain-containing protein [Novipirellula sp. JB048]
MNPYHVLGLPHGATEIDIKKAYRHMAARFHPDLGGSVEKMKEVTMARDILIDPERRKQFDETGETDHSPKQNNEVESMIATLLAEAFADDHRDPIKEICRRLDARRDNFRSRASKSTEGRNKLEKQIERFRKANRGTSNTEAFEFIIANLQSGVASLSQDIASMDEEAELMSRCLSFLDDLKCPPENEQNRSVWYGLDSVSGGSRSWRGPSPVASMFADWPS